MDLVPQEQALDALDRNVLCVEAFLRSKQAPRTVYRALKALLLYCNYQRIEDRPEVPTTLERIHLPASQQNRGWLEKEDQLLTVLYGTMKVKAMCEYLPHRTPCAIENRLCLLRKRKLID